MKALDARGGPNGCTFVISNLAYSYVCPNFTDDGTVWLCYCGTVKNITVSVPDEVYRRARVRAAETGTSVSALVRQHLEKMTSEETEFERLKRLQDEVIDSIQGFSAADLLSRDELHDRDALRRLEYPHLRDKQKTR